jgi:hypothetical protein
MAVERVVDCGTVVVMGKRKLTDEAIDALRADYEQWSATPDDPRSADDVAAAHGVTRQTLYNIRRRWLAADQINRIGMNAERERQMHATIEWLTGELARTRTELDRVTVEIRILREQLGHRSDPE